MSYCPNCKVRITCGCQKAKAKNGASCCTACVNSLNQQLTAQPAPPPSPIAPTNVVASYSGPGKQIS